ncbi:hypothetical protein F2P79_016378 [Pimephales promelas]|nr:hypothetical protein F2P79_016378 [Pimephales promelas]
MLEKEIFMVETPSDDMLPAGLFILPVVLPSSAVEENKFKVLIKNETCKEVTIPSGTVVAHVFPTDTVTVASVTPMESETIDPKVFDFTKSTIPKEWDNRLRQKLSERGSKWFSVLDLRSSYYQIAMADEDKEKTAFICPLGFYEFERMPQGVSGAPATFQRLMERAVGDMHLLELIVYLDDIIVFGSTLEEHEQRLLKVLDRLEEYGLKISPDKCQLCMLQVKYVGHIVTADGVAPDPEKIEAVTK